MERWSRPLPITPFILPITTQIIIVLLSNRIHSQTRSGSLYLLRVFDFLTTLTVSKFSNRLLRSDINPPINLLIPIAFGGSLSWLEFSVIEYETISLILAPILAILQGFQLLQIQKCYHTLNINQPETFILYFTGLTTIGLIIPAFYSWIDSTISADASWESIDYLLIGMSIIFMPNYKYSEIWLQLNLTPHHFMVLEQTKFWIASIGQWFVQNMAHATIFALTGKIVMLGALVRYFTEIKQRQKTDYNDLSLTLFN
ncbi:putative integral membrane protein [Acanthocheilonema viteae]